MRCLVVLGIVLALTRYSFAQSTPAEHPAHKELRALKDELAAAFSKRDLDALLKHLHKDAVVTWQNAVVSRGHKGVRDYYEKMLIGDKSIVIDVKSAPEVAELSVLHGGENPLTAVAYGTLNDQYKLRDGMEVKLDSVWSAALVKEDGRWLIADFHASTNTFDNAVMNIAVKKTMTMAGGGGAVVGLLLGIVLMFVFRRK
jgi:ketosteroid isomerase-like protein